MMNRAVLLCGMLCACMALEPLDDDTQAQFPEHQVLLRRYQLSHDLPLFSLDESRGVLVPANKIPAGQAFQVLDVRDPGQATTAPWLLVQPLAGKATLQFVKRGHLTNQEFAQSANTTSFGEWTAITRGCGFNAGPADQMRLQHQSWVEKDRSVRVLVRGTNFHFVMQTDPGSSPHVFGWLADACLYGWKGRALVNDLRPLVAGPDEWTPFQNKLSMAYNGDDRDISDPLMERLRREGQPCTTILETATSQDFTPAFLSTHEGAEADTVAVFVCFDGKQLIMKPRAIDRDPEDSDQPLKILLINMSPTSAVGFGIRDLAGINFLDTPLWSKAVVSDALKNIYPEPFYYITPKKAFVRLGQGVQALDIENQLGGYAVSIAAGFENAVWVTLVPKLEDAGSVPNGDGLLDGFEFAAGTVDCFASLEYRNASPDWWYNRGRCTDRVAFGGVLDPKNP